MTYSSATWTLKNSFLDLDSAPEDLTWLWFFFTHIDLHVTQYMDMKLTQSGLVSNYLPVTVFYVYCFCLCVVTVRRSLPAFREVSFPFFYKSRSFHTDTFETSSSFFYSCEVMWLINVLMSNVLIKQIKVNFQSELPNLKLKKLYK